jgi:predicted alpha/beta-hydrolase family hydrolase
MSIETRIDGPDQALCRLILAHGAGQGMDSSFMQGIVEQLAELEIQVLRFNFPYMQRALASGQRRPPDREPTLRSSWQQVIEQVRTNHAGPLFIGGKSLGGRIASLLADTHQVNGLVCLGYPFHPPGKPQQLRTQHLIDLRTPTLICQGERDTFGSREEVKDYRLSPRIRFHWLADGDHSFKPRKQSGISQTTNLRAAAEAVSSFLQSLL